MGWTNEAYLSDLVVRGQYAYGADEYGLGVWDVSDPANPQHVSHWGGTVAYGAAVALGPGNQVLLAHTSGLSILDLSDPCTPRELGLYESPWPARAVALEGHIAYVGYHASVLQLIDISDPAFPVLLGSYHFDGSQTTAIAVADDVVYLLARLELQLIDVSDPGSPTLLGAYETDRGATCLAVAGSVVYLGTFDQEFQIVDVSEPASPTLLGSLELPYESPVDVKVSGDLAFVGVWGIDIWGWKLLGGLKIIDISDSAIPVLLGEYLNSGYVASFVEISRATAFVPTYNSDYGQYGFEALDVSDPTVPERLGGYTGNGMASGIEVSGPAAFVANGRGGLEIIDINDPSAMSPLSRLETGGFVGSVAVSGDIAYLAEEESGLRLVDISEPRNPVPVSFFPLTGEVADVDVVDDVAFVADGYEGLHLIDVSNPVSPSSLGLFRPYENTRSSVVVVVDDFAYVSFGCDTLGIIDFSILYFPVVVGAYEEDIGCIRDIAVAGSKAFVIDTVGLKVIDVSDPANPVFLGSIDLHGPKKAVTISGDLVYVSVDYVGVYLIDISDPTNPILLETLETLGHSLDAAAVGNTVYVAAELYLEAFTTECRAPQAGIAWESRGLEVDFSDKSLFGPTSWYWQFGDGATSVEQHKEHRYDAPGTYTVSLTVTNDLGSQTETWSLHLPEGRNECRPAQAY